MTEIEVTQSPELDSQKQRITDLHSVFNVLNIITLQLTEIEMDFPKYAPKISPLIENICSLASRFQSDENLSPLVKSLRGTGEKIIHEIENILSEAQLPEQRCQLEAAKENFVSIYSILDVRLDELTFRLDQPDVWIEIASDTLSQQMQDVFHAMEKNSHGRYCIHFNLALKNQDDYYIDLKLETYREDKKIWMPLRLKDVLRDLLANARKYTNPGGKVALALHQNEARIHCVIEDTGCGIPEAELGKVVEFGYRASNVQNRSTMGGGFGLTKAAWLVLSWGGSFNIASEEGKGTIIHINIPCPL